MIDADLIYDVAYDVMTELELPVKVRTRQVLAAYIMAACAILSVEPYKDSRDDDS